MNERLTDEELMIRYARSDYKAFSELYNRFNAKMFGYTLKKVRNRELAEDILQDVFRKIHKERGKYNPRYTVNAWFFKILFNTIISSFKKEKIREHLEFKDSLNKDENQETDIENIEEAILKLPDQEQRVLELKFFKDLSHKEISENIGISEMNTRKILSRAYLKLRQILGYEKQ